ncbi:hypothetical protein ElyMa_004412200 [Elysia marginata]|uniref:Reverse transcriptase domain-containing protein n=1 Tax=Elysia marginata TaxID=1093978 RepID=A0AAV4H922_9GAST|nr:hypothetical protein ElyMa_004412200 [Elysia marginata]
MGKDMKIKLLQPYNTICTTEKITQTWEKVIMVPIYKRDKDKKKPESYRPESKELCTQTIWPFCATEEYSGTAKVRLQMALDTLRMWTGKWLMKINPEKTFFTTFTSSTVSHVSQTVRLKIEEHQLQEEPFPTYLGVTFDKRLTWIGQTDKCKERGILRTGLSKRLAGTQWRAEMTVLKTVYTGYVHSVLKYGSSVWNTTAKSNQQ